MRLLVRVGVVLGALPLVAATCVVSNDQRGAAGPWVGEVRNLGDGFVTSSVVRAEIVDAAGHAYNASVRTCPAHLAPEETATYTLHMPGHEPVGSARVAPPGGPLPPFTAKLFGESIEATDLPIEADVEFRVVERHLDRRYVFVEIDNNSGVDYSRLEVCSNLRAPDGSLIETAHAAVFPSDLRSGERATGIFYFLEAPVEELTLEFVSRGYVD